MKIALTLSAIILIFPVTELRAEHPDVEAAEKALATEKHSPRLLSDLGDARFMSGDELAYTSYTQAWNEDLKSAWSATKGDSPVWKVLAASVAILGVATDVSNARQGITSNYTTDALNTSGKMMSTLEDATGNKENRQNVKRVMGDIRKLAKRETSSYRIIHPASNRVAGAAMARIHTPNGVCNGVRVEASRYAVSSACLAKFGAPTGVSVNTTLRPGDFATVSALYPNGDETVIAVALNDGAEISTESWRPARPNPMLTAPQPDAWGATWFAPEFDFIVPVFEACSSDRFDDCGDVHQNNAILWVRQEGSWRFYGFATPDGKIVATR